MMAIAKYWTVFLICFCYTGLMLALWKKARNVNINWKEQMDKILELSGERLKGNRKWYEERKLYLSRIGVNYRLKRTVLPEEYFLFQLTAAIIFWLIGSMFSMWIGLLCGVLGFFAPDWYLRAKNEDDNKEILNEVKGIYDTIQVKTQGGMFLTSAITECYKNTRNKRLKKALYEMAGQIIAKNDLMETIDTFNVKFKNKHIDSLCIILKQSLESGKTVEIMESIQDQLVDMQKAINLHRRHKLNSKVMYYQMTLFVVIIGFFIVGILFAITTDIGL